MNLSQADLGFTINFSAYHGSPKNWDIETTIGQTGSLVDKLFTFGGPISEVVIMSLYHAD